MKFLEKVLYTAGGLLAGTLALSVACGSPTPIPSPTPQRIELQRPIKLTPTDVIQLQRPQPVSTPTVSSAQHSPIPLSTVSPTSINAPTLFPIPANIPSPTPRPPKPVIIFNEDVYALYSHTDPTVSKIASYAWEERLNAIIFTNSQEVIKNLDIRRYSGIWFKPGWFPSDELLFKLADFVVNGGRLVFEVEDFWCPNNTVGNSLRAYFSLSLGCDVDVLYLNKDYINHPYTINNNDLPLLERGVVIGYREYPEAHFISREGYKTFSKPNVRGERKVIGAYGKMGEGEIIGFVLPSAWTSIITDDAIDYYHNRRGGLTLLRWLANSIDIP